MNIFIRFWPIYFNAEYLINYTQYLCHAILTFMKAGTTLLKHRLAISKNFRYSAKYRLPKQKKYI